MSTETPPHAFQAAFGITGPLVDGVLARLETVLQRDPYWFPVRHHSPACAFHIEGVIKRRKPQVVFLEGPSEGTDLIPHITDAKTRPPIAIYSSFRTSSPAGTDSPGSESQAPQRYSSWFPLLSFSPEYVAMTAAKRLGAEVVFIDLPHFALERGDAPKTAIQTVERESGRLITESGFFAALARAGGYRSWDEAWDTLFEVRPFPSAESFRRELALFCAAARATASPDGINAQRTLERERFMKAAIASHLRRVSIDPKSAIVVSGGFHMFHDEADVLPPPPLPAGTLYTTVVPFSYPRVSTLSGYAAGNRAPRFYERLFESLKSRAPHDLTKTHAVDVLREARKRGEPVSAADGISVAHTAVLLARLRGRDTPVLDDVNDALLTCCCKGNPAETAQHLLRAMTEIALGTKTGRVTPAVARLPLLQDFHDRLEETGLGALTSNDQPLELRLDLRDPVDSRKSAFLHRCRVIGVPIGRFEHGGEAALFREFWTLRWNPGIEASLIEQAACGDSVETAAASCLKDKMRLLGHSSGAVCRLALDASSLAIPGLISEVEPLCRTAIEQDGRALSLCNALGSLLLLQATLAARTEPHEFLNDILSRSFDRACLSMGDLISAPPLQHEEVLEGVRTLTHAVLGQNRPGLDRGLFVTQLQQAAVTARHPFLRGVFMGFLSELQEIEPGRLAEELASLALSPSNEMVEAGDLLDGMLAASRTSIVLGGDAFVEAIDKLLRAVEWEAFMIMLPKLRAAITRIDSRAASGFAQKVARKYGLQPGDTFKHLPRALNILAVRLDEETSRIMESWKLWPKN